jgi:hypothetical protein
LEEGHSVEDDLLHPGEDPANSHKGDAEHWISVYEELLNGSRRLLTQMRNNGGAEMEILPLERYIHRLETRLAAWNERLPA